MSGKLSYPAHSCERVSKVSRAVRMAAKRTVSMLRAPTGTGFNLKKDARKEWGTVS